MKLSISFTKLALTLFLILPVFSLQAATISVKCDKKSLAGVIDKLEKAESNTINITSDCNEDIVISGHKDLTLIGHDGASITATVFDDSPEGYGNSTVALSVETSNVTFQDLTINGGRNAVQCFTRSVCVFRDVTIPSGWDGVYAQDHTKLYILGSSTISDLLSTAVAAFGASHINMGPDTWNNWSSGDVGPVITGNEIGVWVQDGSFFRSDNVAITNNDWGIFARRDANLKVYSLDAPAVPGVSDNTQYGIIVDSSSTAHILTPVMNNGDTGVYVGPLSFAQVGGSTISGNGTDLFCEHSTSVIQGFGGCP